MNAPYGAWFDAPYTRFACVGARLVGYATFFCAPVAAGDIHIETPMKHKTLRVFGAHNSGAHPTLALVLRCVMNAPYEASFHAPYTRYARCDG